MRVLVPYALVREAECPQLSFLFQSLTEVTPVLPKLIQILPYKNPFSTAHEKELTEGPTWPS